MKPAAGVHHRSRPSRILGAIRRQRAIVAIVASFVILISGMVGYNAWSLSKQRETPLIVNVTERQRALTERYIKDVLLKLNGFAADPAHDQAVLDQAATSLIRGGSIVATTGVYSDEITIPGATDPAVRLKLRHERDLIHQLTGLGDTLLARGKASPTFAADVQALRLKGAQLSSVTGDAAATETQVTQSAFSRLVWVEIILGAVGALAAVGMSLLLWRSGRRQSARFRSLVHNSSDLITVVDEHAVALYQSPSSVRVLGYEPAEVVGSKLTDLLHPNDKGTVVSMFAELFKQPGGTAELGFRLRHRNGSWITMEGSVRNLVKDRAVHGFVVNTRDVTERERVAAELAAARDEAMEASRMKSQFLASMSHEIRTPMNAVIGLTQLLLDTRLDTEQSEYASGVQSAADGLLAIINDILDFSKVEAGKIELEVVDFDLGLLVEDVVALLGDTAHAKEIELLAHRYPGLPPAVRGDPTRLRQVLVNLVSNAVKFTTDGEVVLRAKPVRVDGDQAVIRFEVSDSGIGIAPEDQARMFDPFSQADSSTTRRFGGTGLGLAIVRQLVDLMGGELGCESKVDHGSTFWFELPLGVSEDDAPLRPMRLPDFESLRALVVDDNATNRLILRQQLSSWGMQPDEAEDAPRALEQLRAAAGRGEAYDLIVLDLNMPGMDGLELARAVHTDPTISAAKMFLLSSSGRVDPAVASEAGLSATLSKPVRQSELFNCLLGGLQQGEGAAAADPEPVETSAEPTIAGRVLLVEDNKMNQLVATRILDKLGLTVEVAENGRRALDALDAHRFDAVLMDCQMPEMDGYEATGEIRRREVESGEHLPVIAMTAAAMDGDREICLAAGMDDYITKPVRPDDLLTALRRWIGDRQPEAVKSRG
jgi:two-component system, sensor histidine kinase and response regulator